MHEKNVHQNAAMSLADVLKRRAEISRDDLFVIEAASGRALTYGKLYRLSTLLAVQFRARGLGVGDIVLVLQGNTAEFVITAFALMHIGAVMVPANPVAGEGELEKIISHSTPEVFITTPSAVERLPACAARLQGIVVSMESLERTLVEPDLSSAETPPDHPIVILYTGGSTGQPKGVELGVRSQIADHHAYVGAMGFPRTTRFLQVMPCFHADGWGYTLLIPYFAGISVLLTEPFNARVCAAFERLVREYRANVPIVLPSILSALSAFRKRFSDPGNWGLQFVLTSSERLKMEVKSAFEAAFHAPVLDFYGLTESGNISYYRQPGPWEEGYVGPLHPGVEIRCEDDGELLVKSPYLFNGYFRNPELTKEVLTEGWYRTGDLAVQNADGFLVLKGRKSAMMNRAGLKIHPGEIDSVLSRIPEVLETCTLGVPNRVTGEEVCAFVITKEDASEALKKHVLEACKSHLEAAKLPRLMFLTSMPRNKVGKIDRVRLLEMATHGARVDDSKAQ